MKLTILGCGRFQITSHYNSTGNLVSTNQTNILVDFGRGCLHALTKLGKQVSDIDAICISHTHPDHVADLLAFFQIFFITCPDKPLVIIGPAGIREWFTTMASLVREKLPTQVTIYEQPTAAIEVADITITTAPMAHTVPDTAFCFEQAGHRLVYSGDTGMNDQIVTLAKDADLLLLECSNVSGQITAHHLNPEQCLDIARRANVRRLLLTHYGEGIFSGTLEVAKELMTIEL
ncbi:MAG: ribonuclease Z [Candidatus Kerfeldbacteria bacterium]|nr:ribonuclease Z [Candidatus Kerfeldbacteria bacterium]